MAELLNIILGAYCLLIFVLLIGWVLVRRQSMPPRKADGPGISLIIAMRNEVENLHLLIHDIAAIAYQADKFEVILVNDHSEDETLSNISILTEKIPFVSL